MALPDEKKESCRNLIFDIGMSEGNRLRILLKKGLQSYRRRG